MSKVCIHLHSFAVVHLFTEREVEALRQQMFYFDGTEPEKRPQREKQLPVRASSQTQHTVVDRLLDENIPT